MSSRCLISVIIPTYNRAHMVVEALESVYAQTWRSLEVLVVDDGSTDHTALAVQDSFEAHQNDFALRYISQSNAGGNAARNLGAEKAQGSIIAFLDSDDLWHPSKLERQMAVMGRHLKCGAVYCGVREVDAETGKIVRIPVRAYPQGNVLNELLVRDSTAPTSTYLLRKSIFEDSGGFDPMLRARQDWDLWIRLAAQSEIRAVEAPLVDLRHHSGPRTISDPTRELVAHRAILDKYDGLRRQRGLTLRLAALAAFHRRSGRVYLHHMGYRWWSLWHYLLALVIWPTAADSYAALLGWFLPPKIRGKLRVSWNHVFGKTPFAIRNH